MTTLVLMKNSTIQTNASVDRQCKEKGHKAYDYEIEIETTAKLDDDDFVIDHTLVHNEIKHVIQNEMGSCERLCLRVEERVKKKLEEHGCSVLNMTFLIKPVDSNAWFKLKANYVLDKLLKLTENEKERLNS